MTGDRIGYRTENGIATILFNRPDKKNAFTLEMMSDCTAAVRRATEDDSVGCLVLTGSGDAFCSGIELGELAAVDNHPLAHKEMLTKRIHTVLHAIEECEKPIIAAVNGAAVGAGLDMALACDLRLAARSARMSEGYIRIGLVPGDGGCYFLPQLIGLGRALDLLMTGRFVDAEEAERIGMVNRVVDDAELLSETYGLASQLASFPRAQLNMIKRAARSSAQMSLRAHLDMMSSHLGVAMASETVQRMLAGIRSSS